jgi:DNA-binding NarL/FixJ family response regulator
LRAWRDRRACEALRNRGQPPPFVGIALVLLADVETRSGGTVVRVVIAEDSVLLREGLAKLLDEAGFEVVGQAANADDLLLKVRSYRPDVAIVDVRMPPTQTDEGVRAAEVIRSEYPEVGVLVLSQIVEANRALRLFGETPEGFGYLLKDRVLQVEDFIEAVRRVASGGTALDPEVVSQLLGRRRPNDPLHELTERERNVLALMAEGRSNQAIGRTLFMSPKTVEAHIHRIFMKLGLEPAPDAHRRVLAVLAYLGQK